MVCSSCMDNRPLMFEEWEKFRTNNSVSATPGGYELEKVKEFLLNKLLDLWIN